MEPVKNVDAPTLDQYIDNLLLERGVTGLDKPVMDEMRNDLMTRLGARLNAEMVALLPMDKIEELNDLLDADAEPDVVKTFFTSNIPDYQNVFARTLIDFRTSYLS